MIEQGKRLVTFLTGTRADFGKLRPLVEKVYREDKYDCQIIATGMHLLESYGYTIREIYKAGFDNVFPIFNQESSVSEKMDLTVANTITPLSHYLNENKPDMLVVHGDRVEALAGAISGCLNNVIVSHIEGGETSGTIDESIRHAITKLAHLHFVSNDVSKNRLLQMGESERNIFVIGSPEVDLMRSQSLPNISDTLPRYGITFDDYAIVIYHPVTTETGKTDEYIDEIIDALDKIGDNYLIISPNNDVGANVIRNKLIEFSKRDNVKYFPSIRFEYFLTLLKHAKYILGNSSAGVREAPVFGTPTVNIGSRQFNRNVSTQIFHCNENSADIFETVSQLPNRVAEKELFGSGHAAESFIMVLNDGKVWDVSRQKHFVDRSLSQH